MNLQQHVCVGQPKREEIGGRGFLLAVLYSNWFYCLDGKCMKVELFYRFREVGYILGFLFI